MCPDVQVGVDAPGASPAAAVIHGGTTRCHTRQLPRQTLTQVVNRHDRSSPSFARRRRRRAGQERAPLHGAARDGGRRPRPPLDARSDTVRQRARVPAAHTARRVSQIEMRLTGSVCSSGTRRPRARAQRELGRRRTWREADRPAAVGAIAAAGRLDVGPDQRLVTATLAPPLADGRAPSMVWARTPPRTTTRGDDLLLERRRRPPAGGCPPAGAGPVERRQVGVDAPASGRRAGRRRRPARACRSSR